MSSARKKGLSAETDKPFFLHLPRDENSTPAAIDETGFQVFPPSPQSFPTY
jgi:hypothetical protein